MTVHISVDYSEIARGGHSNRYLTVNLNLFLAVFDCRLATPSSSYTVLPRGDVHKFSRCSMACMQAVWRWWGSKSHLLVSTRELAIAWPFVYMSSSMSDRLQELDGCGFWVQSGEQCCWLGCP